MKALKWTSALLALALVCCLASCGFLSSRVDQKAPDFTVLDEEGNKVQLSDFTGKPVVINFWATWCGPCVAELPAFDAAYAEYPDVVFLMVNATDGNYETVDKVSAFVKENGYAFDVYFDTAGEAVETYGLRVYPTTIFINANGEVVSRMEGSMTHEKLTQQIDQITQ